MSLNDISRVFSTPCFNCWVKKNVYLVSLSSDHFSGESKPDSSDTQLARPIRHQQQSGVSLSWNTKFYRSTAMHYFLTLTPGIKRE